MYVTFSSGGGKQDDVTGPQIKYKSYVDWGINTPYSVRIVVYQHHAIEAFKLATAGVTEIIDLRPAGTANALPYIPLINSKWALASSSTAAPTNTYEFDNIPSIITPGNNPNRS